MSAPDLPPPNIGIAFVKELYTDCKLETNEPQSIYLLYRDTIKTFLHEKVSLLALDAKIFGLIGIEISILVSLLTAKFEDFWIIKGNLIFGTFFAFLIILGVFIAIDAKNWWKARKALSVDALTDDLGARGSIIKSSTKAKATTE